MRILSAFKTIIISIVTILYIPIAIILSIVLGITIGFIGIIIGTLESIYNETKTEYTLWRLYPKRNNRLYYIKKRSQVIAEKNNTNDLSVDYSKKLDTLKKDFDSGKLVAPSPLYFGMLWSLIYIIGIMPILMFTCLLTGPMTVARDSHFIWKKYILGDRSTKKYQHIQELLSEEPY